MRLLLLRWLFSVAGVSVSLFVFRRCRFLETLGVGQFCLTDNSWDAFAFAFAFASGPAVSATATCNLRPATGNCTLRKKCEFSGILVTIMAWLFSYFGPFVGTRFALPLTIFILDSWCNTDIPRINLKLSALASAPKIYIFDHFIYLHPSECSI